MRKTLTFAILCLCAHLHINGQIFCPPDVTTSCFSDLSIDECGNATIVSGNYHPSQIKFEDDDQTNSCNDGQVLRRFYLDLDYDNSYSEGEPYCIQTITLEYESLPLNVIFPSDIELTCIDDVPVSSPTWSHHPCDLVGYTYEDDVYEFEDGACRKIIRHYTVINWCTYEDGGTDGLIEGTQIIKIKDEDAPVISGCDDVTIDAVSDCVADVSLTNVASEVGDCPSGEIVWRVSIDLWADGTDDLFFGPDEPQPYRLDPVAAGEEVVVTLPEALAVSKNKVVWKAYDRCGNVRSCSTRFEVADHKAPTPYCRGFLSATINGDHGELVITPEVFNLASEDNCSQPEEITLSFSENVEDTERVITCDGFGFQFFRIYYTDQAGNQDFCEVFMLVLDNGSCAGNIEQRGVVRDRYGAPIVGAQARLHDEDALVAESMSTDSGDFTFGMQSLMTNYQATAEKEADKSAINLTDYRMLVDAALGRVDLDLYQAVAADINEDGMLGIEDLAIFRDELISGEGSTLGAYTFLSERAIAEGKVERSISIMDYDTGYDFIGVVKGDLVDDTTNGLQASPRERIHLTAIMTDDEMVIRAGEGMDVDYYQFELSAHPHRGLFLGNSGQNIYDTEAHLKVANLSMSESVSVAQGSELIAVHYTSDLTRDAEQVLADVVIDASWLPTGHRGTAEIIWHVIDHRSIPESSHPEVKLDAYPSVFTDQVRVIGQYSGVITVMDVNGTIVHTMTKNAGDKEILAELGHLTSGVYFITYHDRGVRQAIPIVKM